MVTNHTAPHKLAAYVAVATEGHALRKVITTSMCPPKEWIFQFQCCFLITTMLGNSRKTHAARQLKCEMVKTPAWTDENWVLYSFGRHELVLIRFVHVNALVQNHAVKSTTANGQNIYYTYISWQWSTAWWRWSAYKLIIRTVWGPG